MKHTLASKILCVLITLCMLVGMVPVFGLAASALDATVDADGTTILISTPQQLAAIGKDANYPRDGAYKLVNDIDLSKFDTDSNPENGNWAPLCAKYVSDETPYAYDATTAFIGTFDGQGYTISGMKMIFDKEVDGLPYNEVAVGLFAGVGNNTVSGTVKNLVMKDCHIFARPWTKIYTGIVAAQTNDKGAIIDNVAVIESSIDVTANNTGNDSGVGGIVGNATGSTISNVYVDAALKIGTEKTDHKKFGVAGIVGAAWQGRVKINGAVFDGTIDTTDFAESDYVYKQGIFAYNWNYPTVGSHQAFSNSYYNSDKLAVYDTAVIDAETGEVTTTGTNGGHYNGEPLTTAEFSTKKLSELGLNAAYWSKAKGKIALRITYPKTVPNFPDYIPIYDAGDLAKIGKDAAYPLTGNYMVMNDIDMADYGAWTPIAFYTGSTNIDSLDIATYFFSGTLNGGGHKISNYSVSYSGSRAYAGLFGLVYDATFCDLIIENASVDIDVSTFAYAGVLVGAARNSDDKTPYKTTVNNVAVYDSAVTVENTQIANLTVAGGIAGHTSRGVLFTNCYVETDVTASYVGTTGQSAQVLAGGLMGSAYKSYFNAVDCIFAGTVTANNCTSDYAGEVRTGYKRQNALFAGNTQGMSNDTYENIANAKQTNCYYLDTVAVNKDNLRGVDGTAISADALKTATAETLGFDAFYWKNDGEGLYLAVAPAMNADGKIEISTAEELAAIGVNSQYPRTGSYVLTADIDLSVYDNWTPLCGGFTFNADTVGFTGTFDGQGYTIRNMKIAKSGSSVTAGFFGNAIDGAVIKNIVFDNCTVDVTASREMDIAIVVGRINSMSNYVNINNIAILNSSVNGVLTAVASNCGMGSVVGQGTGLNIKNVYTNAELSGGCEGVFDAAKSDNFGIGGLVGRSYNAAVTVDGAIFDGTIDNIASEENTYIYANGILGYNWKQASTATNPKYYINCYYNSEKLTPSTKTNGGSVDGVALNNFDLGISPASVLGFSSEYWMHNGTTPILKIVGDDSYTVANINGDAAVNVKDLVRLKKYLAGENVDITLIAADLKRDQEITADDLTYMRRTLLGVSIATTIKLAEGSDSVKYLGRANVENNILLMDWSNTGFEFSGIMEGDVTATLTHVSASAATAEDPYTYARVLVNVDGVEKIINVNNGTAVYTLAEDLDFGAHTIKVLKITERTKGRIYGIDVNFVGSVADRPADKDLVIDFYGDSITAGDGVVKNDRKGSVDYLEGQYSNLTYAAKTAKALNADMRVAARSGLKTKDAVSYLINAGSWDYENNQADIVVINLGTNDKWVIWDDNNPDTEEKAAHEYGIAVEKAAIEDMLDAVVANYPDAKIVWVYGMMGNGLAEHIQPVVEAYAQNNANVFYCELPANTSGGGNHPNEAGHAAAADVLVDFINANVLAK